MTDDIKKLLKLIKENPDLPIFPMVDYDVVGENCGVWKGSWGEARIDEYVMLPVKTLDIGRIAFKSDEDIDYVLSYYIQEEKYKEMTIEETFNYFNISLPWTKAIIVDIHL